ncbi:hypothetical protein Lalb_Chr12g0199741 [Lupinus albus]|uniref:Clavata3/ESR (CLE) gene family member n=1 Tax=Lupinus albus TaxID=3870 RepID=A0A6A4PMD4_LUPAL|nr:hypothetical protein Lalb_Chr12g0199741 [Lupinus albus]
MRLQELILVMCLLFLACIGSNTMARKTNIVRNMFGGAKEKNTSVVVDDFHKCNPKSLLSCSENNNTTSNDKRVVPTGPNPLHNR